jgi:hypothetical protein
MIESMRVTERDGSRSVQAIAGTRVVPLGIRADEDAIRDLLNFSVERAAGEEGDFEALPNFLLFESKDTGEGAGGWLDAELSPQRPVVGDVIAGVGQKGIRVLLVPKSPEDGVVEVEGLDALGLLCLGGKES